MEDASIKEAAQLIRRSHSPVIFTGAGVSQESGVPTFRDALTGFWEEYDPQALATPEAFAADPDLVWAFYEYRRGLIRKAKPNAAHGGGVVSTSLHLTERFRAGFVKQFGDRIFETFFNFRRGQGR